MCTMLEPWPDFAQPPAIVASIQTELLLDCRINKDARDVVIFCRQLNQMADLRAPQRRHHALAVASHQIQRLWFQELR